MALRHTEAPRPAPAIWSDSPADAICDWSENDHVRSTTRFIGSHTSGIARLVDATFEMQTFEQAERVASIVAMQCPSPETACVGLWELLSNAIEHGNLEIGYDKKAMLLRSGGFDEEINRRLGLSRFSSRIVRLEFKWTPTAICIRVTDDGNGFDFEDLAALPEETDRPNGRGIFIAKSMSFDRLTYLGRGNVVEVVINLETFADPA